MSEDKAVKEIVDFGDQQVFNEATTYTALVFLKNEKMDTMKYCLMKKLSENIEQMHEIRDNASLDNSNLTIFPFENEKLTKEPWVFLSSAEDDIVQKLSELPTLSDITQQIFVGLQTSADPIYIVEGKEKDSILEIKSKKLNKNYVVEKELFKEILTGRDIKRWKTNWQDIISEKIKKNHILQVNIVGGEPLLRPDILEVFNQELPGKFTIVTNGTYKLIPYSGLINYWISIDGSKENHDKIRGKSFDKIEKNVIEYVKDTKKKVWISMTINTWNSKDVIQVAEYWKDLAESINFQFHTPFMEKDPLWIPYGDEKNKILNQIISLKKKYPNYVINEIKQLKLLEATWGGDKNGPVKCPNWAILVLDHFADAKTPCCLGSAKEGDQKPMCQNCGMSNYSSLYARGIHF